MQIKSERGVSLILVVQARLLCSSSRLKIVIAHILGEGCWYRKRGSERGSERVEELRKAGVTGRATNKQTHLFHPRNVYLIMVSLPPNQTH